jgi:DNA-binding MarR family transcriptional regulator
VEGEYFKDDSNEEQFSQLDQSIIVDSRTTDIDLEKVDEIKVDDNILIRNVANNSISYIRFAFETVIRNLEVNNLTHELNFVYEAITNSIVINLAAILETNQTYRFYFSYDLITDVPLYSSRKQSFYFFRYHPSLNYYTQDYTLTIKLPSKCFLHHFENSDPYYPDDATELTEDYKINLIWEREEFLPLDSCVFFAFFDEPLEGSIPIWVSVVAPLSGIIGGASAVYWLMKRKEKRVLKEAVTTFLADDQKLLLRIIVEAEGRITQKEIIEKTGFTKSKTSRNLVPLEKNNLITKERWGREYRIYITDKGRKVIESSEK